LATGSRNTNKTNTMKFNFTKGFIVLLAVTLSYSACKKSTIVKPSASINQPNPDLVAKQIAASLYKSLTGQMGGSNINDGIKAPANLVKRNNKTLNDVSSLCGYTLDTAYSSYTTVADTDYWVSTKFIFTNTCSASSVDGYAVYDSVKTETKNGGFVNSCINIQKYNVNALDNTFKLVSCNGSINTTVWNTTYATTNAAEIYHALGCNYNLQGLKINLSKTIADITEGTATYTAYTHDIDATTGAQGVIINYTGNIVFEGNYTAKLTIDPGHIYTINFLTNTITPQ